MKFTEFERKGKGKRAEYVAAVRDVTGAESHDLTITGPNDLIQKVFKVADFSIQITPGGTREDWERELEQALKDRREEMSRGFALKQAQDLFKKGLGEPRANDCVFVTLHRVWGKGTFYRFSVPLFLPTGRNLFFILPPVCTCFGLVFPASGDPDLFLTLNGISPPVVSASTLPNGFVDRVAFSAACWPWTHFIPFFRVRGFLTTSFVFTWGGFGIF